MDTRIPTLKPRGRGPNKHRPAKIHISFRIEKVLVEKLKALYAEAWRQHINEHLRKSLM
jgi:uncharacterized protein (DUF4415 family)